MINTEFYDKLISILPKKNMLIAVSKTKPAEDIQEFYTIGHRDFGENKVQELLEKIALLPKDIHWHLIGPLQENKVNKVVGNVQLIHSVGKLKLAEKINRRAEFLGIKQNILLQINLTEEESKSGFIINAEFNEEMNLLSKLSHINIMGLMTMGFTISTDEQNKSIFNKCKHLLADLNKKFSLNMTELSMGMSGDYEIALQEGATKLRVGSKLFGSRNYNV